LNMPKNIDSKKDEMTRARTDISLGNSLHLLKPFQPEPQFAFSSSQCHREATALVKAS
jgi:hypothetical protein